MLSVATGDAEAQEYPCGSMERFSLKSRCLSCAENEFSKHGLKQLHKESSFQCGNRRQPFRAPWLCCSSAPFTQRSPAQLRATPGAGQGLVPTGRGRGRAVAAGAPLCTASASAAVMQERLRLRAIEILGITPTFSTTFSLFLHQ